MPVSFCVEEAEMKRKKPKLLWMILELLIEF